MSDNEKFGLCRSTPWGCWVSEAYICLIGGGWVNRGCPEGCDVVLKLGHMLAMRLPLASSRLWEFSFHGAIWMCRNTTRHLCNNHSPANLDFSIPLLIFGWSPKLKKHGPAGRCTPQGQRRKEGIVPSMCKIGGFMFGYLHSLFSIFIFNIWKMTITITFWLWLFSQLKLCWKSLFHSKNAREA